ncbi:hypothetical protein JOB18_048673 [Solea senegalensis]|uniref:Uncharacterized protein n=1 Tax=Solea senegalensis TaxID=28829 RepID=A0AAV6PCZ9_SOLSE|nr:hypothetical protein JOB18_048673 [Solea senegalensis]
MKSRDHRRSLTIVTCRAPPAANTPITTALIFKDTKPQSAGLKKERGPGSVSVETQLNRATTNTCGDILRPVGGSGVVLLPEVKQSSSTQKKSCFVLPVWIDDSSQSQLLLD